MTPCTYLPAIQAIGHVDDPDKLSNHGSQQEAVEDNPDQLWPQGAEAISADPENVRQNQKDCATHARRADDGAHERQGKVKLVAPCSPEEDAADKANDLEQGAHHESSGEAEGPVAKPAEDNQRH
jgi:uncharacterized protein YoaH (UPF0181 family)